jgi:glucose/arabinose dehydrogenase
MHLAISALKGLVVAVVMMGVCAVDACAGTIPLRSIPIASGLTQPLFVTAAPGDHDRLFVIERAGRVRIIRDGEILTDSFLDIRGAVVSAGSEQGLLGLAFHPDYANNGFFYVNYTVEDGLTDRTVVSRFTVSAANDLQGNAQNLNTLLGKMLRIDVDGSNPYAIPPSNPFVNDDDARDEIWAYGLRNPWRFSFDRETGDMYIGDVGQGAREEIDFQPASSVGGENYGWKNAEGFACRGGNGSCGTDEGFIAPILDYARTDGRSVTGGYVYRGRAIPGLEGTYFYADHVTSRVWSLRFDGETMTEFQDRTDEFAGDSTSPRGIASFGEDARGELYLCSYSTGEIFKIAPLELPGDVNADGEVNAQDVQTVINGALGLDTGSLDTDINGDGSEDAVDVQIVINAALGVI